MWENVLHPLRLKEVAKQWLFEDARNFDYGGAIIGDIDAEFIIYMKSPGVLAGIPFANAIFSELSLYPNWIKKEGEKLLPIAQIAKISGSARNLLLAERVVLNVLSRASGVATTASQIKSQLTAIGWEGILAGTRKTTPGFRIVEKYSLLVAGVDTHRYDLSSMVMLKDNHVKISGSIQEAVKQARKLCGFTQKIEVECRSLDEARAACQANCDIVMLDNFKPEANPWDCTPVSPGWQGARGTATLLYVLATHDQKHISFRELKQTASVIKNEYPKILIEASGGITSLNVEEYASPCIDIISTSSVVQGYNTIDFSMKVKKADNCLAFAMV